MLIFSGAQWAAAICSPFTGRIIDRIGVRVPATLGTVLFAGGMYMLSEMQSAGLLYWAGMVSIGVGAALAGPIAYVRVVASWWDKSRALMLAWVVAVSATLSQVLSAPVARWLIDGYDWRFAYRVLALAVLVIGGISAAFFLHTNPAVHPPRDGQTPAGPAAEGPAVGTDTRAFRTRTYWAIAAADCLATASVVGVQTHLVAWFETRGISSGMATFMLSVLPFGGMVGVVVFAFLIDRIPSHRFSAALFAFPLVGVSLMFFSGTSLALAAIAAVCLGTGLSVVGTLMPYLLTRYFGTNLSSQVYGLSMGLNIASIGTLSVLISAGVTATGGYTVPMSLVIAGTALPVVLVATLKPFIYLPGEGPAVKTGPSNVLATASE